MAGLDIARGVSPLEPLRQTAGANTGAVAGKTVAPATGPATGTDQTRLSAAGSLFAQGAAAVSDVRHEKVAALKASIAAGTYNVPSAAVADKLIVSLTR